MTFGDRVDWEIYIIFFSYYYIFIVKFIINKLIGNHFPTPVLLILSNVLLKIIDYYLFNFSMVIE